MERGTGGIIAIITPAMKLNLHCINETAVLFPDENVFFMTRTLKIMPYGILIHVGSSYGLPYTIWQAIL